MIRITPSIEIDESAIVESFVHASGPGGQNVNKVATAVQLRFDPAKSGLSQNVQTRVLALAGRRVTRKGDVLITAQRFRTQERNRRAALDALARLIGQAAKPPSARIATKPTVASRRRRMETKAHRARIKRARSAPVNEQ